MAEFDDKLNSILSNPDAMAQIMQLAQSIGGNTDQQSPPSPPPPAPMPAATPPAASSGDLLSSLTGGLDSNARQLLFALRPYLKAERQEKIERALQLARLFHIGRKFLSEWEGGKHV